MDRPGDGGLWIAEQVGDTEQDSLAIELSPTTRQALLDSVADGFPDWFAEIGR